MRIVGDKYTQKFPKRNVRLRNWKREMQNQEKLEHVASVAEKLFINPVLDPINAQLAERY